MADREDRAGGIERGVGGADIGVGGETEGDHRTAAAAGFGEHTAGRVVDVDDADVGHGAVAAVEEGRLRVEVRGEIAVVVDVVPGEVGEGRDAEMEAVDAVLMERVGTDLEAGAGAARVDHLAKEAGEVG